MNIEKTYNALSLGIRTPRKHKLEWLGRKMSKKKLSAKVKVWDSKAIKEKSVSYFCPNCGNGSGYLYDHGVEYPEIWVDEYCLRCHTKIAYADNSPWRFALNNFNPL